MSVLTRIHKHSSIAPGEAAWLATMVEGWNLLADLSFSDLVLWVPDADDNIFWAVAQKRPATGPTALEEDVVGESICYVPDHLVTEAHLSREICSTSDNKLSAGIPVDVHAIPIVRDGACIGVVERHTNQMGVRAAGALEDAYLEAADVMTHMLHRGDFPFAMGVLPATSMPRVGDGIIRISSDSVITYASPNSLTAFRQMGVAGDMEGESFPHLAASLADQREPTDEPLLRPTSKSSVVDLANPRASLRLRILPLRRGADSVGWLALCRDTSELRHQERQLVTKDATIREIHHRVKNNLQTVAALLRMQARRVEQPEARKALEDAKHRVAAIALVHEVLSHAYGDRVNFDEVADTVLSQISDVAAMRGSVNACRRGSFGAIPGGVANHLALVITELTHNAVEHGLCSGNGEVVVEVTRDDLFLTVRIIDDGMGLSPEADGGQSGLGLSIVRTLVADMEGRFTLTARGDGHSGSVASVEIPQRRLVVR